MKNKLQQLLDRKSSSLLSVFITAGFPALDSLDLVLRALEKTGVDFIEVGMPFSDPLADGPVIQDSSMKAIANGMTVERLFEQLKQTLPFISKPIVLMGYLNPVIRFGIKKFYSECAACGVSGLILPDLPLRDYEQTHRALISQNGLCINFLVTPATPEARIKALDAASTGFLYLVSSNATTGHAKGIGGINEEAIRSIAGLELKNKLIMGFGIKSPADYRKACGLVNGAIIGSAFVSMVAASNDPEKDIPAFIHHIKQQQP